MHSLFAQDNILTRFILINSTWCKSVSKSDNNNKLNICSKLSHVVQFCNTQYVLRAIHINLFSSFWITGFFKHNMHSRSHSYSSINVYFFFLFVLPNNDKILRSKLGRRTYSLCVVNIYYTLSSLVYQINYNVSR